MVKKIVGLIMAFAIVAIIAGCSKTTELDIRVGRARYAAHGTKSFADVVVVFDGDKILAVSLDEYQIGSAETFKGVPNSDSDFGKDIAEGNVLYSKLENDEAYSKNMKDKGNATKKLSESYEAIVKWAEGKTKADLVDALKEEEFNAISGSTLVDTKGYVEAILEAVKKAESLAKVKVDKVDIKLGRVRYAAHGTKSFADVVTVLNGDKVIAVSLDEYQIGSEETFKGVPNSDSDFGKDIAEGNVLYSKLENDEAYSKNMKDKGNATKKLSESYEAIVKWALEKTLSEIEEAVNDDSFDGVAGSTLVDTKGYVEAILAAGKAAK